MNRWSLRYRLNTPPTAGSRSVLLGSYVSMKEFDERNDWYIVFSSFFLETGRNGARSPRTSHQERINETKNEGIKSEQPQGESQTRPGPGGHGAVEFVGQRGRTKVVGKDKTFRRRWDEAHLATKALYVLISSAVCWCNVFKEPCHEWKRTTCFEVVLLPLKGFWFGCFW